MKNLLLICITSFISISLVQSQSYTNWDNKSIEEFYEKVSVKRGSLGEDGRKISYVFVPTEIKRGTYEVRIVDYKNDLYEIKGSGYYVKFRGYVGFWGYSGKEGVLEVGSSAWSSKFYIKP
jgi:hypothetical protein